MPSETPSIRELVWLTRLRQVPLFGPHLPSECTVWLNQECDDLDCHPWYHKRKECRTPQEWLSHYNSLRGDTPVT